MRTLIVGTAYVQGGAAAEMFRVWVELTTRLNPGMDILVVDSASPMELPYFPPPLKYLNLEGNVGHLSRGGKDGWGRAFSAGVTYAIEKNYDWLVSTECDLFFAKPVSSVIDKMSRSGVKCCAPIAQPYSFTETGLSFWSVPYLKEIDLVGEYDWQNPPNNGLVPEQRVDLICDANMFALPLRGFRNDARCGPDQLPRMFSGGIDWITHAEIPVIRRFLEMTGHDDI